MPSVGEGERHWYQSSYTDATLYVVRSISLPQSWQGCWHTKAYQAYQACPVIPRIIRPVVALLSLPPPSFSRADHSLVKIHIPPQILVKVPSTTPPLEKK